MLNLDDTFTFTTPGESIETSAQTDQKQNEGGEDKKDNGNEDEEQEFEFRLFSAPAAAPEPDPATTAATATDTEKQSDDKNNSGTQKLRIRLRSPTPGPADLSEGRFVNPSRGWQYYFTTPVLSGLTEGEDGDEHADAALKRKQFEEVAVSGQHMLGWASLQPWVSVFPSYHLIGCFV